MPGRLLEGERQRDQPALAPGGADERDPDRQAEHLAGRHADTWITGDRGGRRARAAEMVAVHEVGRPRRTTSWCDEGIEAQPLQDGIDPERAGSRAARRE